MLNVFCSAPSRRYHVGFAAAAALALASCSDKPASRIDLLVSRDAVYRVSYEDLAAQGMSPTASRRLQLTNRGEPVPYWVDGPDPGQFGPGSTLTFVGEHLRGEHSRYNEFSKQNVYRLSVETRSSPSRQDANAGIDLVAHAAPPRAEPARIVRTLEEDRVRVRFNADRVGTDAEVWYWQRLSVLDQQPFTLPIDLGKVSRFATSPISLRVNLRGWSFSHSLGPLPDHRAEVLWNDVVVASAEWNGQSDVTIETGRLPRQLVRDGESTLQIRVPMRHGPDGNMLVDVSLLNWIEVEHAFDGQVEAGQLAMRAAPGGAFGFAEPLDAPAWIYSTGGERVRLDAGETGAAVPFAARDATLFLVAGEPETPDAIRADVPSSLRLASQQADYLMISHASLIDAARPLAEFHRGRGLSVALIDVQDIYDEFNHGVLSPEAIRDFIAYAHGHWQEPKPRFVLLVGDASWENHGESLDDENYADWTYQPSEGMGQRFIKNGSTAYADLKRSRNLVPTLQAATYEGQAASDSELVNIEGDDFHPDLAIGRLPVVEPAEVEAIVEKLIAYETRAPVGPWRRSALWIANEEAYMQNVTNAVALDAARDGMRPTKVYPAAGGTDNAQYQAELLEDFEQGNLFVHFFGHGGRYIWRTGPPDPRKNHDLFTLDHLDQLPATDKLPLILSMTCYSAPFDHPTADSIGEKFLRTPQKGAVGVFAASWRNSPTQGFSQLLVSHLLQPGTTVGEAVLDTKRESKDRIMVQTYNYLGDPATRLRLPATELPAAYDAATRSIRLDVEGQAALQQGTVLFDLYDAKGGLLSTFERPVHGDAVVLDGLDPELVASAASVGIYAWNQANSVDAMARIDLSVPAAGAKQEQPESAQEVDVASSRSLPPDEKWAANEANLDESRK